MAVALRLPIRRAFSEARTALGTEKIRCLESRWVQVNHVRRNVLRIMRWKALKSVSIRKRIQGILRRANGLLPVVVAILAVVARFVSAMTVHAGAHRSVHFLRDHIPFRDRSMTGLARGSGCDVRAMTEKDVRRNLVDSHPR